MKRLFFITLATAIMISFSTNAQVKKFLRLYANSQDVVEIFSNHYQQDALHRVDARQILPLEQHLLLGIGQTWTDGVNIICTLYFDDKQKIKVFREYANDLSHPIEVLDTLMVKNGVITSMNVRDVHFTVEQLGNYKMLIARDKNGLIADAFYHITNDEFNNGYWTIFMHYLLDGNYRTSTDENSVFGLKMPFYNCERYCSDPGVYSYAFNAKPGMSDIDIEYGARRVNHGDPSSPKYGKMPGGGGAGALMGPMVWNVSPTVEGLKVRIVHDERFVDHFPRVEDGSILTKLQCPYDSLNGKWAFASVIPLTPAMLSIFPKEVLTLMRGEIYARYGDTFENPETQHYFDGQPWYKKNGNKVVLTDVERFNYALIKQVEMQLVAGEK